jgi:hypothetical protein
MRTFLAAALSRLARWLHPKSGPGSPWTTVASFDAFGRARQPSPSDLLAELKGAAWTCASINAGVCASFPPRLYVATHPGQPAPKCRTRQLEPAVEHRFRACSGLPGAQAKAARIEEVLDHPLLTLLRQVNPVHNGFDLWLITREM